MVPEMSLEIFMGHRDMVLDDVDMRIQMEWILSREGAIR
jgi:hypothetical protein